MVNNFSKIKSILKFGDDRYCYLVQLLSRKKDGKSDHKNGDYLIRSMEQFNSLEDEIISRCTESDCRAYINLNRRDIRKANLELVSRIMKDEIEGKCIPAPSLYASVLSKCNNGPDKMRVVDVDDVPYGSEPMKIMNGIIQDSEHSRGNPVIAVIPSKSGFHILANGFNPSALKATYPNAVILPDAMTNLYIP